jgi:hypothetical protein
MRFATCCGTAGSWSAGKARRLGVRELLFLVKAGDAEYAPLQTQYGRLVVEGDRLIDSFQNEPRQLSATVASIERLVRLQARAASNGREADRAYVEALRSGDPEVRSWPLDTASEQIDTPSRALVQAFLARRPSDAGAVARSMEAWRPREAAPSFAKTLATSADADERGFAARALGSTGDVTYLPLLRRVAASDADFNARALSYLGIKSMLGPDSLADLRLGANDPHHLVRAVVVSTAYNLLELEQPQPRWPPASDALIDEVRDFLAGMQQDPAQIVSGNAKSALARLARRRK